jgi:hypothetical protein
MSKSGIGRNQSFFKCIYDFEEEAHPPQLPAQSALSSPFMVKNAFQELGIGLSPDLTTMVSINLHMI